MAASVESYQAQTLSGSRFDHLARHIFFLFLCRFLRGKHAKVRNGELKTSEDGNDPPVQFLSLLDRSPTGGFFTRKRMLSCVGVLQHGHCVILDRLAIFVRRVVRCIFFFLFHSFTLLHQSLRIVRENGSSGRVTDAPLKCVLLLHISRLRKAPPSPAPSRYGIWARQGR